MNETAQVHFRALREDIDVLSAKVDAIHACLREEIQKKARRRERIEFRLFLIYVIVGSLYFVATVFYYSI